jgi:hypothetical protein
MMGENNCKGLLERILEITIERGEVSQEKSIGYHQEYKEGYLGIWKYYYLGKTTRNFQILMSSSYVILSHLEMTNIGI